jgi:hypothetical protein
MEPAISVDQSPVSNPRRRPSIATRASMAPSFLFAGSRFRSLV